MIKVTKVKIPMDVMVEGIVIDARRVEIALLLKSDIRNIPNPITVNPLVNVTCLRDVQGANT